MSEPLEFPADENGHVLRQIQDGGHDLTQPRVVDFCFVFPERK